MKNPYKEVRALFFRLPTSAKLVNVVTFFSFSFAIPIIIRVVEHPSLITRAMIFSPGSLRTGFIPHPTDKRGGSDLAE